MATDARVARPHAARRGDVLPQRPAQNEPLCEQMEDIATVYEQIADPVESHPLGDLDMGGGSSGDAPS